jgi:hypothetical protein
MNRELLWLGGFGFGAGLMYLLDPDVGRRRRARLRDRVVHAAGRLEHYLDTAARDISHRAQGLVAESRALLAGGAVPDDVLVERVRSKLGHCVSHPHALDVKADNGRVVLSGPILEREVAVLLACVTSIRGVSEVVNHLEVHRHAGTVPRLQGGRERRGDWSENAQSSWPPAARLLACAVGCGLMANCVVKRTPFAALLGTVGFGLFARGLTNLELTHLAEIGGGTRLFGGQGPQESKVQAEDGRAAPRRFGNGKRQAPRSPEMGTDG